LGQRRALIALDASISSPNGTFTTPEMVALERDNLNLMHAGCGQNRPSRLPKRFANGQQTEDCPPIKSRWAQLILTTPEWLASIEGRAGSANTTTVGSAPS
jgi:hypothetical protein